MLAGWIFMHAHSAFAQESSAFHAWLRVAEDLRWSDSDVAKWYEICDENHGNSGCKSTSWMGSPWPSQCMARKFAKYVCQTESVTRAVNLYPDSLIKCLEVELTRISWFQGYISSSSPSSLSLLSTTRLSNVIKNYSRKNMVKMETISNI